MTTYVGSCHCGAVRFEVEAEIVKDHASERLKLAGDCRTVSSALPARMSSRPVTRAA
jgi:hypothetical protein